MTATLIARLVERGILTWHTRIGDHFPHAHESLARATLRQLLSHTAGLPRDFGPSAYLRRARGTQTRARRDRRASTIVRQKPQTPPGERFDYSNVGYTVAAVMAERAAGDSFEHLMRKEVFAPLGMDSAAYGAPTERAADGEACGHLLLGRRRPVRPAAYAARSQHYAPASTVFMPMGDWVKFAQVHLDGGRHACKHAGFLRPESFDVLHRPVKDGYYALGWFTQRGLLQHAGGNPFWESKMWLYPAKRAAILLAFNQGWDAAAEAAVTLLYGEVFPRYIPGETYSID